MRSPRLQVQVQVQAGRPGAREGGPACVPPSPGWLGQVTLPWTLMQGTLWARVFLLLGVYLALELRGHSIALRSRFCTYLRSPFLLCIVPCPG